MKNFKFYVLFLIALNNFSRSQQKCREYKNFYENAYHTDQIYLLESNNVEHTLINKEFISQNSENLHILLTECQLKIDDIIEYSKQFPYLINLFVSDFYENNFNKVTESLAYAGEIYDSKTKVKVCKSAKPSKYGNETCQDNTNVVIPYVKLVTQTLEETRKEIFKTVLEYQPKRMNKKQLNVIICERAMKNSHYFIGFEINELEYCSDDNPLFLESVRDDTLAVLAPKVFDISRSIDNPVVFYKESYITKETRDWFRNSMTAVPWQSLKHGFLFLITKMKWTRVAIISDSNEYSQEFEKVLTTLFNENGIVYMAETCVTSNCENVIDKIIENSARIIIANFDIDNMRSIASYAKFRKRKLVWITRNLPVNEVYEAADLLRLDIFNIYFEKNLVYVLRMLNSIWRKIKMNCETEPCSFDKRAAAVSLQDLLKISNIKITWTTNHNDMQKVGSIGIKNDNIIEENFYFPNHNIDDSFKVCTFWNKRFENPCGTVDVLLLMVVLIMFFLTLLGVFLFFESPELETSYRRMR